jgi:hypothetical protein
LFGEFANLLLNQISLASSWDLRANGSEDGIASVRAETETLVQTSADRLAGAAIDQSRQNFAQQTLCEPRILMVPAR